MRAKYIRILILALLDAVIVLFSLVFPLVLRFGVFNLDADIIETIKDCLFIDIALALAVLAFFKLYNRVWTYAGTDELIDVFKASLVIEAIYIAYRVMLSIAMPRSFYVVNWLMLLVLFSGVRISMRLLKQFKKKFERRQLHKRNVMIIGAGAAASMLIKEIKHGIGNYSIACIIDDNPAKKGKYINGIPIVGNREDIPTVADRYDIDEIIIAMPSVALENLREIITICYQTKAKVKRLPGIATSLTSSMSNSLREVNYEDLLGREEVVIKNAELEEFLRFKTVMVTGGGGSIGSELCRQIMANNPERLIIVDNYENTTFEIQMELKRNYPDADVKVLIASVREYDRMDSIFAEYRPHVIYHAAAHKHVPLMEDSPCESVKNNCKGTLNLVKLADKYKVKRFVLISTDKAVRPTNVMGATKRICEMIIQTYNKMSETEFVAVRFGNVLGSNGSVIPLFLKQIETGGPITLTHKEITRFFMTINEAVSLVLKAGLMAKGGEIFVLDMGRPVKIYDLAVNLIKMKGLTPDVDIEIKTVGLRPGEKLYEELLMAEEGLTSTSNDLIFVGRPIEMDSQLFLQQLDELICKAEDNSPQIKAEVRKVCDTYVPQ